jgi:hypothetical protein
VTEVAALQSALAAEHAIIWGYGVVGAHLEGADRAFALRDLAVHMAARDRLTALIATAGATPVVAKPAYQLPTPVTDATTARALAAHLEQGGAGSLWDLIAATAPGSSTRSLAIRWLGDTEVRAAHWGAPQALPGQPNSS